MAAAGRPPFVWLKPVTGVTFSKLPLQGAADVDDLHVAAAASLKVSATMLELLLVAPPSAQPPLPAAIAAALLGDPLPMTAQLESAGVVSGCWLLARVADDALTAALAAAAAAQAATMQERLARLAAEAALGAESAARGAAEAAAVREREARLAAQALSDKKAFLALMLSISSAGSGDTASHADEARRGAPLPESALLDAVLDALPAAPSPQETSKAWKSFAAAHARVRRPTGRKLDENRDVHPTIGALLGAALGRDLRLWCNALAEDDVAMAKVRPDFTITHARDAMPSTIGALLLVEVKLPGDLPAACTQARAYLRRSIYKRCAEADARGEGMERIHAYALATDGRSCVALKMRSGAPPPGASFQGAVPCPVVQSQALALLEWSFLGAAPAWGKQPPPEGFAALHRLCAAPAAALAAEAILTQLRVQLQCVPGKGGQGGGSSGGGGSAADAQLGGGGDSASVLLALGARLGCGGSSDVYECSAELGVAAVAPVRAPLAAKVSRFTTELVQGCFARERAALLALSGAAAQGLVPTLIATGTRVGGAADWPLLLLQPCGQSLPSWVAERVAAGASARQGGGGSSSSSSSSSSGSGIFAARAACASAVVLRLLDTLKAAHAASLVHCDVRPSNIVVVRDAGAMLVDWGISRAVGAPAAGCGVAAYADRRVFEQGKYQARPAQDVIGALLTWLCVAHSEHCDAPWRTTGTLEAVFSARAAWMAARSAEDAAVARVVAALRSAEERWSWAGSEEDLYTLAREAVASGV